MTLEQTHRRLQAVSTIHDIVGAMRAIAAGRVQGAQRALESSHRYEDVVVRGLLAAANGHHGPTRIPPASGPALVLVMTAEQPFCGSFNQNVLTLAEQKLSELAGRQQPQLIVVGRRGAQHFASRQDPPLAIEAAATSVHGLRDIVKRLAAHIDHQFTAGRLGAVWAIYNRYQSISVQVPTAEQVLPLDLTRLSTPAPEVATAYQHYLTTPALVAGLVSQYAFIRVYRIAADSFASEQASRLTAMDGATRNAEKMLASLVDLQRRERQGEITREVLELVASRFAVDRPTS